MEPEKPFIIELNMKTLMRDNIVATIGCSLLFLFIQFFRNNELAHYITFWSFIIDTFLFFILYALLIVLHEAFHLLGFMIFGRVPFNQLHYGLNLNLGVAYATTKQPLSNKAMQRALLLPFWTTGVLPAIIGFYINSTLLLIVAAFLIAGAVGDFAMYKELRKFPSDVLIKDDTEFPRLYVYTKQTVED